MVVKKNEALIIYQKVLKLFHYRNLLNGRVFNFGNFKKNKLIVTVIDKEKTDNILKAKKRRSNQKHGYIKCRGISENKPTLFFRLAIKPQREVIYTLVPQEKVDRVFDIIMEVGELDKLLQGLVFVIDVEKIGGIDLSMFQELA